MKGDKGKTKYRKNGTTIFISKDLRKKLAKKKIHPRQSYDDVIEKELKLSGANLVKVKEKNKKSG